MHQRFVYSQGMLGPRLPSAPPWIILDSLTTETLNESVISLLDGLFSIGHSILDLLSLLHLLRRSQLHFGALCIT